MGAVASPVNEDAYLRTTLENIDQVANEDVEMRVRLIPLFDFVL